MVNLAHCLVEHINIDKSIQGVFISLSRSLRLMDTHLGGGNFFSLFCPTSEKGSTLKGKNLLPFFPFRVDPFSERVCVYGR